MAVYSYSLLFLILLSPLIQLSIFCISYGTDLKDIKVYITNLDPDTPSNCATQLQYWDHGGLSTLQWPLHDGSIHSTLTILTMLNFHYPTLYHAVCIIMCVMCL